MNIKQSFTGMFVALTVSTVGAATPSYPEDNVEAAQDTIQTSFVTKAEFDSLKAEVSLLKESYEESSSGSGFGSILWSLIFGIVGGAVTVVIANKYLAGRQQQKPENVTYESTPNIPNEGSRPNKSQTCKKEALGKKGTREQIQTVASASEKASAIHNQQENRTQERMHQNSSPTANRNVSSVKVPINESPRQQEVKKRLYANIMIPSKGMLIIPDYAFSDVDNDVNFQFDLNQTQGIGTYTITPTVLKHGISSLSVLEKYVEPFEFDSNAKQINVVRPGTVVHVGAEGYWKVESKMVISLS